ncbi:MAG TPA: hypothetical protein VNV88_09800, partial [Candidatus Solibacter sp.]|nr:hypothetical protein [Candidatus Solibacter sp.]
MFVTQDILKVILRRLAVVACLAVTAVSQGTQIKPGADRPVMSRGIQIVRSDVHHDVSAPLRDLLQVNQGAAAFPLPQEEEAEPVRPIPLPSGLKPATDPDLAHQSVAFSAPAQLAPTAGLAFDGLGNLANGFTVHAAPPDTNGAVGLTQYVQWVNSSFAIFDKANGALIAGPTAGNLLWANFDGGPCETTNRGDPIVTYDKMANRWVMSQFAFTSTTTAPFLQCVAVSTTADAMGSYNRYSFTYSNFDDYPKMGVWPDAYYVTFNMFNGNTFVGADACAYDRNAMLNGQAATQICFQQGNTVGPLLPSDFDGTVVPPAGSPNFMVTMGSNALGLFKFHVDFATPANSTFTGPTALAVLPFSALCNGKTCVPQPPQPPAPNQLLDSLADRLMYRFAYRNFGDHESLVVNHSVAVNSNGGVRWYEIQAPNGSPTLAQQSTFAPDTDFRWMGSIAMDKAGDIALGYSISSSTTSPSIGVTGRTPSDPANTMQAESLVIGGTGSQTSSSRALSRWGDYSAMQVDPSDDCTFWFTTEYMKTTGVFNWNTRIASFKFPNCVSPPVPDFSLSASPVSVALKQGSSANITINVVNPVNGFNGSVSFAASGLPSGVTANFSPTSSTSSTTLTLTASGPVSVATATVTITGTSGNLNHVTKVAVTFGLDLVPVTPCRISDTRNANGPFGGPFVSGGTARTIVVPNSACNIPATAQAYSVNVTVVPRGQLGFLTLFPCGQSQPLVSTLNATDGRVKAGAAIVPAGTNGAVCAFASNDTDVVLDINGYFVLPAVNPSALAFYPLTPCRLVDTRNAVGTLGGPSLVGNGARTFPILSSSCNVPGTAQAYSLNFTSVPKNSLGFLTTWPAGQSQPLVSTLNAPTGAITANAAIVPAGTNGDVSVFVTNDSDLVIDINGYFAPVTANGLALFNLSPCRVLDTRNPAGSPPFTGKLDINVAASTCGVPVSAQSFVLNATVVPPGPLGFLTMWPQGAQQPLVSTLNATDGVITSNMAIVPTTNGSVSAFTSQSSHLVLDISAFFAP